MLHVWQNNAKQCKTKKTCDTSLLGYLKSCRSVLWLVTFNVNGDLPDPKETEVQGEDSFICKYTILCSIGFGDIQNAFLYNILFLSKIDK